jgi:hypothetical protein
MSFVRVQSMVKNRIYDILDRHTEVLYHQRDSPRCKSKATPENPRHWPLLSLLILHEIDDISRFRDEKKLCAYAGLVTPIHASRDMTKSLTIVQAEE